MRWVVEHGADEVDMVIDRGAFLSGRYAKVYDEIVQVKEASGDAHLKVILEVAELGTYDAVELILDTYFALSSEVHCEISSRCGSSR